MPVLVSRFISEIGVSVTFENTAKNLNFSARKCQKQKSAKVGTEMCFRLTHGPSRACASHKQGLSPAHLVYLQFLRGFGFLMFSARSFCLFLFGSPKHQQTLEWQKYFQNFLFITKHEFWIALLAPFVVQLIAFLSFCDDNDTWYAERGFGTSQAS